MVKKQTRSLGRSNSTLALVQREKSHLNFDFSLLLIGMLK